MNRKESTQILRTKPTKEGKGEREEEKINLPVMSCFHTPQKAMPLFINHTPKR